MVIFLKEYCRGCRLFQGKESNLRFRSSIRKNMYYEFPLAASGSETTKNIVDKVQKRKK